MHREEFETWVKQARVSPDLSFSDATKDYNDLDIDWLWLAYQRGVDDALTAIKLTRKLEDEDEDRKRI